MRSMIPLEFHGHNDLGMATANTIAALAAGASAASVTVNGLGERAGNACLEEVVMAARLTLGLDCGVQMRDLAALSSLVSYAAGRPLEPDKPVVGDAVFAHESGIHCAGLLFHPETYELFPAGIVGHSPTRFVIGRHLGRAALVHTLARLQLQVPPEAFPELLRQVRRLAMLRKAALTDYELRALVADLK